MPEPSGSGLAAALFLFLVWEAANWLAESSLLFLIGFVFSSSLELVNPLTCVSVFFPFLFFVEAEDSADTAWG
jgi:hypothetical protein